MSVILPIVLGLLALCGELFVREAFALTRWAPDFAVVIVLWLAVSRGWAISAFLAAAVIGLMTDGFVGSPAGIHVLQATLLVLLAGLLAERVRFRSLPGRLLLGGAGSLVSLFLLVAICRIFLGETAIGARVGSLVLPRTVLLMLVMPIAYPILDRLDAFASKRREVGLG
ncbi:MAG: rod shape-determining protein MreD [Myxococcales bacterium]|nr:rod shape-determining protein MreD [Myxococcales bacterium]